MKMMLMDEIFMFGHAKVQNRVRNKKVWNIKWRT